MAESQTGMTVLNTVNLDELLLNSVNALPHLYSILGVVVFVLGFWYVAMGVLDLATSTGGARFMGARKATPFSGLIKILLGGVVANFAMDSQIVNVVSSIAFGDNTAFALASIDSYSPTQNQTSTQYLITTLVVGFTQIVGLISIFVGLRIWILSSDGRSSKTPAHGLVYIIGGVACVQFIRIHDFFSRFIGFDLFQLIGVR